MADEEAEIPQEEENVEVDADEGADEGAGEDAGEGAGEDAGEGAGEDAGGAEASSKAMSPGMLAHKMEGLMGQGPPAGGSSPWSAEGAAEAAAAAAGPGEEEGGEEETEKQRKARLAAKMAKMANAGLKGGDTTAGGFGIRDLGFAMSQARGADGKVDVKNIAKKAERIHAREKWNLEDLKTKGRAEGVDPVLKEDYLNDDAFEGAFGMDRDEFYKLPQWKRNNLKKKVGLF